MTDPTDAEIEAVARALARGRALGTYHESRQREIDGFVERNWRSFAPSAQHAILAYRTAHPHLFMDGEFVAHSGTTLPYKIDCDALSDADLATLATEIARRFKFSAVEGVPRGGLRLAKALEPYATVEGGLLVIDDVLTTGASMEKQRAGRDAKGVVIFARGPWASWVLPLFCDPSALAAEGKKFVAREPTGAMWSIGRSRFGMEAERYRVLDNEKAQAWADTAPTSIWRAMWDAAE